MMEKKSTEVSMSQRAPDIVRLKSLGENLELHLLRGEGAEMADLQRVLEEAPDYARRLTGYPASATEAQSTYTHLPTGWTYDDKFVYGIYLDHKMIGCVDLIRGYPDATTAMLGLLLLSEKHQGRGWGSRSYLLIEEVVRRWGTCHKVRIGVIMTNDIVLPFWKSVGFVDEGLRRPYRSGTVESEYAILEKPLSA